MKQCTQCKVSKPLTEFYRNRSKLNGREERCKECRCRTQAERRATPEGHAAHQRSMSKYIECLKHVAYEAYGGFVCACCGETEEKFLSIDHVNGGGSEHRKVVGGGHNMYRWLKKNGYPDGYQVLCFNCNWGKYLNGGVCPHKELSHV